MGNNEDDLALVLLEYALQHGLRIGHVVGVDRQIESVGNGLGGFLGAAKRRGVDGVDTLDHVSIDELSGEFRGTLLSGGTQTGILGGSVCLLCVTDEDDSRRRLRFEEPGEADRNSRVDDDDLDSAAPAAALAILVGHVVAHGTRLYEVFPGLTMPDQRWRSCFDSITTRYSPSIVCWLPPARGLACCA